MASATFSIRSTRPKPAFAPTIEMRSRWAIVVSPFVRRSRGAHGGSDRKFTAFGRIRGRGRARSTSQTRARPNPVPSTFRHPGTCSPESSPTRLRRGRHSEFGLHSCHRWSLCHRAPAALLSGQSRDIVGTAASEAAWTAVTFRDFDAVYQRVIVFHLLGMVTSTERARGHLSPVEHCCTPWDLAPGCDEGAMAVPTSLFSTAAQNVDPSHHRYLDRCTYSTSFVPCRIEDLRDGLGVFERDGNTLPFEDVQDRVRQGEQQGAAQSTSQTRTYPTRVPTTSTRHRARRPSR